MWLRTHFSPGTAIVQVGGRVEACTAARLNDDVDGLASAAGRPFILDLGGVDFFSCDGFRALVGIAEKPRRTGVRWAPVTSEAVDRILSITNSNYRLPIAPSEEQALHQLTSPDPAWSRPHRTTPPEVARC